MKKKRFTSIFLFSLLLMSASTYAQLTVSGSVHEKVTGEPVIGASVLEEGTTNGSITDFDGNFTLQVAEGANLTISYVGF